MNPTIAEIETDLSAFWAKIKAFLTSEAAQFEAKFGPLVNHVAADLGTDAIQDGEVAVAAAVAAAGTGPEGMLAAAGAAVVKSAAVQGLTELSFVTTQAAALNAVAQAQVQLGQSPVNKPVVNQ